MYFQMKHGVMKTNFYKDRFLILSFLIEIPFGPHNFVFFSLSGALTVVFCCPFLLSLFVLSFCLQFVLSHRKDGHFWIWRR